MFNICSDLSPELINGGLFHQHPVAFFSRLVKFKFLVESSEQVRVNVLEKLFYVVLDISFDICLENIHKIIIFKSLGIETRFQNLKAIFNDETELLM